MDIAYFLFGWLMHDDFEEEQEKQRREARREEDEMEQYLENINQQGFDEQNDEQR